MPPVDEGMIHAWLDGALSASEAARIEQLVASDPAWAAAAAEARGLIAASSRILSSLDAVPAQVVPTSIPTVSAAREQLRVAKVEPKVVRRWRPQAWAAAATLVMAVGAGVLWRSTPAAERTVMPDATTAVPVPGPAVATAPDKALDGAASTRTVQATPVKPTDVGTSANAATKKDRADQVAAARTPASEPAANARTAPSLAEGVSAEHAKEAKKAEDASKDLTADLRVRQKTGRAVAAGAGGAAPAAAAAAPPSSPGASGAVAAAEERVAANAPPQNALSASAQNALKASAASRDEAVDASSGARRALASATPITGCWTVRLSQYTPSPSFPVPVGVMLDSAHSGGVQVARALVGSNAPTPAPGQWTTIGDSVHVTIDRVVLGYTLRAAVALPTRTGRATLGDATTPVKASALAELQPARCGAP